jgi:hypothetical protein
MIWSKVLSENRPIATSLSYVLLLTVIFFLLLVGFVFVSIIVLFDKFLTYIENMKYMGTISNQPEGLMQL